MTKPNIEELDLIFILTIYFLFVGYVMGKVFDILKDIF